MIMITGIVMYAVANIITGWDDCQLHIAAFDYPHIKPRQTSNNMEK